MVRLALIATILLQCIPAPAWAAMAEGAAPRGIEVPALPPVAVPSLGLFAPVPSAVPTAEGSGLSASLAALPAVSPAAASASPAAAASVLSPVVKTAQEPRAITSAASAQASLTAAVHGSAAAVLDGSRPLAAPQEAVAGSDLGEGLPPLASPAQGSGSDAPRAPPAPRRTGVRAYLSGVFGAQVANNALNVTLPITLLSLGQSLASVGFVTSLTTAIDMSGTLVSGWLTSRVPPAAVLTGATAARAAALVGIPVLAALGTLSAPVAIALFCVDALGRGVADTARNTVPMSLVGKDKTALDGLNSTYQTAFEAGGVVGPLLTGLLLVKKHAAAAHWAVAASFAAAALAFAFVPRRAISEPNPAASAVPATAPAGKSSALRGILRSPWMRLGLGTSVALSLTPALKALVPALFAKSVLQSPDAAAWLVLAFGLGGTAGSMLYNRLSSKLCLRAWMTIGAAGALALAAGLLPGGFWPLAAAGFVFATTNVMARLSLTSSVQERIPDGAEGGVMGLLRFASNLTSMGLRFAIGLAFTVASTPLQAFSIVAAGLGIAGAAQYWAGRKLASAAAAATLALGPGGLRARPSPVHGLPGRLIVVEGLDGSGKSTQLELIKQDLESRGLDVVVTSWNSSERVSEAVKKAKKEKSLTPTVFAHLNAADLADRLESTILPALREGKVVLADRWFYTALARDSVRGNDPKWLRSLYGQTIRPDLALYFKLPVDTAIGRVLSRSGKAGLSEDYEDNETPLTGGPKHYEAGLDLRLSDDPIENFKLFQTRVTASYDAQVKEFGLKVVDATKKPDQVRAAVAPIVDRVLGDVSAFRKADADLLGKNLFDKDPAGDAENIRANYLHDKKGAHFYFRNMLLPMQERFAQLMDMESMPRVFLHGSPHVDNYSRGLNGTAIIDFDRSRVGPYAWDLTRALVSVSLRRKKSNDELLDPQVARQLLKGYLRGLRHPEKPFSEMRKLKNVEPKEEEESTSAYLAADKKWAKEMRSDPLSVSDPKIQTLLAGYRASQKDASWLNEYEVTEAGRGRGSMGFRDIYLVALTPKHANSGKDSILLSFKQVRSDADTQWYKNPYDTQVERMMAAAELYAPGFEGYQGGAMLDGKEFHARAVPPFNAKLKKMLDEDDQADFLYAIGTQLGRAHALSYKASGGDVEALEALARSQFPQVLEASLTIRDEILSAHKRYLKRMRKEGLEPHEASDE